MPKVLISASRAARLGRIVISYRYNIDQHVQNRILPRYPCGMLKQADITLAAIFGARTCGHYALRRRDGRVGPMNTWAPSRTTRQLTRPPRGPSVERLSSLRKRDHDGLFRSARIFLHVNLFGAVPDPVWI
jgi:hypothetical protein